MIKNDCVLCQVISESGLSFENEISQADNLNATAHLFIQNNGLLYKKYFDFNDLTKKNIDNILVISENRQLKEISELAFPVSIVASEGQTVGYIMPYYEGMTMKDYLEDNTAAPESKLSCFKQLANVILKLPDNIIIGDFHLKNVIVDNQGLIHLIDLDGFSVKESHILTCPLVHMVKRDERLQRSKYFSGNEVAVSRETDILCFYEAFLYFLIGNIYFSMYSPKCFCDYLFYLEKMSFPKGVINDIRMLFSDEPNRISSAAFSEINAIDLEKYSFRAYAKSLR